jgi:hypothetical protein
MFLKLPGFEVMADGQVQVEGKSNQLFVNGKPFMDGDTKLGSKYPFGCSDKVQVLRNFNEVSQMKGSKIIMMILRLISNSKKGKIIWFGDVSAGLANDKGYFLKVFYYSQNQYQPIVNLNNIGRFLDFS